MSFKLSPDARSFYRKIKFVPQLVEEDINIGAQREKFTMMEFHYLMALVGMSHNSLVADGNYEEITKDFVESQRPYKELILGALVSAELHRAGIQPKEGNADIITNELFKYLSSDDPANLTATGFDRLNAYAEGGFRLVRDTIGTNFTSFPYFLLAYLKEFFSAASPIRE